MTAGSAPTEGLLSTSHVFRRHLGVASLVLPVSLVGLIGSGDAVPPVVVGGCLALLLITLAIAIPGVQRLRAPVCTIVAMADVVAIAAIAADRSTVATCVLVCVPVAFVARSYGDSRAVLTFGVAIVSVGAALGVIALQADSGRQLSAAATVALAGLLATGACMVLASNSSRTMSAQADLLQRQAAMLETALRQARARGQSIQDVLDSVDFAVVTLDPRSDDYELNAPGRELLESINISDRTPFRKLPIYDIDGTTPLAPLDVLARVRSGEVVQCWLGHSGTDRLAMSLTSSQIRGDDGSVASDVVTARDITAEREAIQARDDMVASLSHELRTPMSSVIGYVELTLEDPSIGRGNRESLAIALKNANRVVSLVGDLMRTKADAALQGLEMSFAECDFAKVLGESVEAIRPVAAEKILAVSLDAPPILVIEGDPYRLRNVIDNLLSNAVKYNEYGGWIDIILERGDDGSARLTVTNTGATLTEKEQDHLFERFFRSDAARSSTVHGTGIGLSVVREIVEAHNGRITVDSSPDAGTTSFIVELPVERAEAGDAA